MTALIQGSLGAVAKKNNQSLAETFMQCDAILLADISASMSAQDCPGGKSRWTVATEQLTALQRQLQGKVALVAFSETPCFCPSGILPATQTSTDLTRALEFVKPIDGTGIKIIVVSDGEPNNEITALNVAQKFQTKIDVVFIGPETGAGRVFLQKLAAMSGGVFADQRVSNLPQLAETVTRLIAA